MKNIVTASIHFSFKGKNHAPSITLELDRHIDSMGTLPDLYQLIARENDFDLYSYEYEMMQAEPIHFSNAEGLVKDFITDGVLDLDAFTLSWQENKTLNELLSVAEEHLNIKDFSQHDELKQALMAAYLLGKKDKS
ncbi:MAG TPA: hypothetical protein ENJ28_02650 [Gammaproteobacteria bacterium]|nr:hypothetical protein [Gammaproteobacteria bacterium]